MTNKWEQDLHKQFDLYVQLLNKQEESNKKVYELSGELSHEKSLHAQSVDTYERKLTSLQDIMKRDEIHN